MSPFPTVDCDAFGHLNQGACMGRRWTVPGLVGAERVLRDRPDSTETLSRVAVAAAGHLAPLEQPLATTRLIADFLETL